MIGPMIIPLSTMIRCLAISIACLLACGIGMSAQSDKPRIVVLTDISNEPDDQESLVRFLTYANETLNIILEVRDVGTPPLWAYRRAVITIQP
jgi:hypothetical protein